MRVSPYLSLAIMTATMMSAAAYKIEPDRLVEDLTTRHVASSRDATESPSASFSLGLPRIRNLRICRISIEPPKLEYFKSSLSRYTEAIEFIAETDGEVPVRAYGPALFVGDVEISYSERVDKTTWRWLAFEPEDLKAGAPISWGWMKDPEMNCQCTTFRYKLEGDSIPCRPQP